MLTGRWENDIGSQMILVNDGGRVSGFYITSVGDERVVQQKHPLVGMAVGDLIGFVVAWPEAGSLTTWTARLTNDTSAKARELPALHAIWHLARQEVSGDPPRKSQLWETFLTNSSLFRKISDDPELPKPGNNG